MNYNSSRVLILSDKCVLVGGAYFGYLHRKVYKVRWKGSEQPLESLVVPMLISGNKKKRCHVASKRCLCRKTY